MVSVLSLWLPILLSAVGVFVVSSLIHMVLGYHENDYVKAPAEEALRDDLRRIGIEPGEYVIPHASGTEEMKSPEYRAKLREGPVAMLRVGPNGEFNMGVLLGKWFVFSLVVSALAAYVAGRAVGAGAEYLEVFRFAGVSAFLAYGVAQWADTIWYFKPWKTTLKSTIDALAYALVTAGVFGWLWPA